MSSSRLIRCFCFAALFTSLLYAAPPARAAESDAAPTPADVAGDAVGEIAAADPAMPATPDDKRGTWTMLIENDSMANADRHYTNGVHLSWLSASGGVPRFANQAAAWVPFLLAPDGKRRIGFNIGQSMFTPNDITIFEPQPGERPYAGWLYGGVALLSETPTRLDTLELDVGVVGPAAHAEDTQKLVHRLLHGTRPEGWDNQLENEPGVALIFERKWRYDIVGSRDGFGIDATPLVGATLGNVFTYGAGGLAIRIGENLGSDFGPPRVRPSLPGSDFFDLEDRFGWYLFAGAEGRAVARNIFLDGNTFSDSADIDKLPFVGDFYFGFAVMFRSVRLTFSHVTRTREFRGQSAPDKFGALGLSVKF